MQTDLPHSSFLAENERRFAAGIRYLNAGDRESAMTHLRGLVPERGELDLHYSLYVIELLRAFDVEALNASKYRHGRSLVRTLGSRLSDCHDQHPGEATRLFRWFKGSEFSTLDKVHNSESGLRLLPEAANADSHAAYKQTIDAYKDKFEIEAFINYLANVILIGQGQAFTDEPFRTYDLRSPSNQPIQRRRMQKGLAIDWLIANTDGWLRRFIRAAYDAEVRNLSGHHAYAVDLAAHRYNCDDGSSLSFDAVLKALTEVSSLQIAVQLLNNLNHFNTLDSVQMHQIGVLDWAYDDASNRLIVIQHYAHYEHKRRHTNVLFHSRSQLTREKTNSVMLSFDNEMLFPYDLMVLSGDKTIEWLRLMANRATVDVEWVSAAPVLYPFDQLDYTPIWVWGYPMYAANGHVETIDVVQDSIRQTLRALESMGFA